MKKTLAQTAVRTSLPTPASPQSNSRRRRWTRLGGGLALLALVTGIGLSSSRPAHTAGGPIPVAVTNTPLAVTTTDAGAPKQPFSAATVYQFSGTDTFAGVDTDDGFVPIQVPIGKRLIVQTVAATADGGDGSSRFQASILAVAGGAGSYYPLPIVSDFGIPFAGTTQVVNLSVDPGAFVGFSIVRANPVARQFVRVSVFGYLVNQP